MWTKEEVAVLPIILISIILVAFTLGHALKNKSDKIRNIPLIIIAVIILVLEVIKQVRAIVTGYSGWTIPLHFCSFFMVWFPLAQFTTGKVKQSWYGLQYCNFNTNVCTVLYQSKFNYWQFNCKPF